MRDHTPTEPKCRHADAIVSYLYRELNEAETQRFEDHLIDCTACTDEFAAVSFSRYGVFEWHREEFEPLETPVFEIPETVRAAYTLPSTRGSGVFAGLAALIAGSRLPAYSAALAAIAFVIWLGSYVWMDAGRKVTEPVAAIPVAGQTQIAASRTNDIGTGNPEADRNLSEQTDDGSIDGAVVTVPRSSTDLVASPTKAQRINSSDDRRSTRRAADLPSKLNGGSGTQASQTAQRPVLSEFETPADNSPRLTDLFDQIGSES